MRVRVASRQRWRQIQPGPGWTVVVRPRRLRWISLAVALLIIGLNLYSGLTLGGTTSNGGRFFPADRLAVAGVGAVFAAAVLLPWRLRVQANATHVRVRNLIGDITLPWEVVDGVRFDRKAAWASLELSNDELVPVLAVQVLDRQEAVAAVRRLRAVLAESQRTGAVPGPSA